MEMGKGLGLFVFDWGKMIIKINLGVKSTKKAFSHLNKRASGTKMMGWLGRRGNGNSNNNFGHHFMIQITPAACSNCCDFDVAANC
jgi:hypothetical protein